TIRNSSSATLTNKVVTLTVAGANPFTTTQTIATIAPGADANITFTAVPKTTAGSQTLTVSVPADQQTSNDTKLADQNIYCDTVGYSAGNLITGGLGYNTGSGILANLLVLPSTQEMYIKKVRPRIATGVTNTGNSIKGVLLNSAGVIIDSTASYTIVAGDLGNTVEMTFINGAIDVSGDSVYYGLRQSANATSGYFPLATQDAFIVLPNKYCGFNAFGGGFFTDQSFGVFMIEAVLSSGVGLNSNATNGTICSATPLNLTNSTIFSNYSFTIDGTVAQNGPGSTYSYTPTATTTAVVTANLATCSFTDSVTVSLVSALNTSVSAGICPGASYSFGGQSLTTSGTYVDTLASAGGCDSIVTLTLANYVPSSASITAGFCPGGSYSFGTQTLTTAGSYSRVIPNSVGCDSTISLTLVQLAASSAAISESFCQGSSLTFGTQTITTPGTYTRTIPNAVGCDSVITLTASYQTINTTVTQTGATLSVPVQTGATYRWIKCPVVTNIAGATNPSYTPLTLTGSYACIISFPGGCKDTTDCIFVDQTGLENMNLSSFVEIFPNPSTDVLNVQSNSFGISDYKVLDINGRVILKDASDGLVNTIQLNTTLLDKGTYILELNTEQGSVKKVFIKQ
ncbi:MAG: T9SS type A sorting domain-containing protein, partial [Bacteroidota bacterium]